jgi:hypothetical protein
MSRPTFESIFQLGGVERVYYGDEYRIRTGLDVLRAGGIEATQLG